jgi:uncharacterized protein (DUF169 family)
MTMPRTTTEILALANELANRTESEDDAPGVYRDAASLRALTAAFTKRAEVEAETISAVAAARSDGYSWALIGSLIGTSGQAARERYGALSH